MLRGRGRTKRAVGSMRGKKIAGLGALARRGPRTPKSPAAEKRQAAGALQRAASRQAATGGARASAQRGRVSGAVASRGGRPTPRRRSPFGRRAGAQQRAMLRGARGGQRVQARRR